MQLYITTFVLEFVFNAKSDSIGFLFATHFLLFIIFLFSFRFFLLTHPLDRRTWRNVIRLGEIAAYRDAAVC